MTFNRRFPPFSSTKTKILQVPSLVIHSPPGGNALVKPGLAPEHDLPTGTVSHQNRQQVVWHRTLLRIDLKDPPF